MREVARVVEVWRYPVKSLLGERVDEVDVAEHGVVGDRVYGVRDVTTGRILSAKHEPRLFGARARTTVDTVEIELPGGVVVDAEDGDAGRVLSDWLDRPVRLETAGPETADRSYERRPLHFYDSSPIHVITTASLRSAGNRDVRRFRPNVVLEADQSGFPEDGWVGLDLAIGTATIHVRKRCERCVMTTHAQDDLPADEHVLAHLRAERDSCLGLLCEVVQPGTIAIGQDCHTVVRRS